MIVLLLLSILLAVEAEFPRPFVQSYLNSTIYSGAASGSSSILTSLLDLGGNIESLGHQGQTAFLGAVENGHLEVAKLLLQRGADPLVKSLAYEENALHLAVKNNQEHVILWLPAKYYTALIEEKNVFGNTPFNLAVIYGSLSTVEILFQRGCNIETKNNLGRTPFLNSCAYGHLEILKSLVKYGASISIKSGEKDSENTGLHLASYFGHVDIVQYLVAMKPSLISLKNGNGETPLYLAAYMGHEKIVQSLIVGNRQSQSIKDNMGLSPLHIAAR